MRYVVDVTQLIHWPGNLTGIPRVMDELAIRFHTHKIKDVVYVSWVKQLGEMCEVDFVRTRNHRGNGIDYKVEPGSIVANPTLSTTPLVKPLLKKVVRKIAAKSRFDRTELFRGIVSSAQKAEMSHYRVYHPQKSDRLFIPWGEWWDQNWLDKVKLYSSKGVLVYPICHDVVPMVIPQFSGNSSSLADFVSQIFPIAETVVTPSYSAKNDLIKWMNQRDLKVPTVKVFGLGEDFTISKAKISDSTMIKKYDIKKNGYLIFVSTIEPRKNHALLYYTYKLAISKGIELPKLLIVGRVGHDTSEIVKFIKEDPEIQPFIKVCDYVIDDELNWLYKNCMFTVVPSFYEGWGITVIESIARGKPAICTNTSSLREIPDRFVIRFSPASTDECLRAMTKMMEPGTLKDYTARTKEYTPHSWDGSFNQILDILKEKK